MNRIRAVATALLLSIASPNLAFADPSPPPSMIITRPPDVRELVRPRLYEAQTLARTESPLTLAATGPKDIGLVKTVVVLALVIVVVVVVGGVILITNAAD